jgi:hypothetical protein
MFVYLTVKVELSDGASEQTIIDFVSELDYKFAFEEHELNTEIVEVSTLTDILWSGR